MSLELHHKIHEEYETSEKYLRIHKKKWIKNLDRSIVFVSVLGPLMTLPQLYEIWIVKNAEGVSIFTWSMYCVMTVFWIFYGLVHKEKAILLNQSIWMLVQLAIVLGLIIY